MNSEFDNNFYKNQINPKLIILNDFADLQWIVTAAHCVQNAKAAVVHLGSLRAYDENEEGRKVFEIDAEDMHVHPKFSRAFFAWKWVESFRYPNDNLNSKVIFLCVFNSDIGLVKLPQPVEFSDTIKSIPYACSSAAGVDVVAIGNGLTANDATTLPPILQYTELKTISTLSCMKTFPFLLFRRSALCAKGEEQRSACQGDSGGPLITLNNSLVGLTSFGSPRGCQAGAPQVYSRLSQYKSWIEEVSGVVCKN